MSLTWNPLLSCQPSCFLFVLSQSREDGTCDVSVLFEVIPSELLQKLQALTRHSLHGREISQCVFLCKRFVFTPPFRSKTDCKSDLLLTNLNGKWYYIVYGVEQIYILTHLETSSIHCFWYCGFNSALGGTSVPCIL